jgi:GWxTD domain-containing protein
MSSSFGALAIYGLLILGGIESLKASDSTDAYLERAAVELREFENLPTSLKFISRFFGERLNKAEIYLKKVRQLEPNRVEAEFLWGIFMKNKLKLDEAEIAFRKVASEDGRFTGYGFSNVWLQLGYVYREARKFDLAIDAFKQGAVIDLTDTWPLFELSIVFLEMGRVEEFTEAFMASLNDIRDSVKIQRLFIDVYDIAAQKEIAEWKTLTGPTVKLDFLRTFWKKRDPNPINAINERLIEHYKRLNHARTYYSRAYPPYYDERGSVYVVLGKPNLVYVGKSKQGIRENESWMYDHIKTELSFDFVDRGGSYIMTSLVDAADGSARTEDLYELFNERSHLSSYYQTTASKIRTQADVNRIRAEERLRNALEGTTRPDQIGPELDFLQRTNFGADILRNTDLRQDHVDNLAASSRQYFVFNTGAPHLPLNVNFASFRGTSDSLSRMEFYYIVPFKNLNFVPDATQLGKYNSTVDVNVKFYDLRYNELGELQRAAALSGNSNEVQTHFYLDQVDRQLAPGRYIMALEARNNEKDRVGIYQFVVNVRDYRGDTLTVSDIEIAQYVDNTLVKDKFVKPQSTLKVVPNPAAGILKTKPLTVYYEIYNLSLNDEGKSSYQVSYSIRLIDKDESFLSTVTGIFRSSKDASTTSVTTKEGKSRTEREYIAFDITELPAGIARLEIKVKDLLSGAETSSFINITIVEEEGNTVSVESK